MIVVVWVRMDDGVPERLYGEFDAPLQRCERIDQTPKADSRPEATRTQHAGPTNGGKPGVFANSDSASLGSNPSPPATPQTPSKSPATVPASQSVAAENRRFPRFPVHCRDVRATREQHAQGPMVERYCSRSRPVSRRGRLHPLTNPSLSVPARRRSLCSPKYGTLAALLSATVRW